MKNVRPIPVESFTDKYFDGCMRITTAETKYEIERLLSKNSVKYLTHDRFVKENYWVIHELSDDALLGYIAMWTGW
jgi:hypothetical protein